MKTKYKIGNRKVAIIGVGYVGSSIAYALALRDVAREIVMIDVNREKLQICMQEIIVIVPIVILLLSRRGGEENQERADWI